MNPRIFLYFPLLLLTACTAVHDRKPTVQPLPVRMEVVQGSANAASSHYVGTVETQHEVPLSIQTAGRVVEKNCRNGERVSKGQVLLRVDSTQAVNTLRSAEAALRHAEDGHRRVKQVHEQGVVSDQQMVEIESKLEQARSLYDAARKQLSECELRAPANGVVSGLDVEEGQTVMPGVRLLSLLDMSSYRVRFTVPEIELNNIVVGQKGYMDCAATGKSYSLRVNDKGLKANPLAHTYEVLANIQGGQNELLPGMVGKVIITSEQTQDADNIVIPARCVHLLQSGHAVWLKRNGEAHRAPVEIGGYRANGIWIQSGLQTGDTLIIDGYQKLYEGCPVCE